VRGTLGAPALAVAFAVSLSPMAKEKGQGQQRTRAPSIVHVVSA